MYVISQWITLKILFNLIKCYNNIHNIKINDFINILLPIDPDKLKWIKLTFDNYLIIIIIQKLQVLEVYANACMYIYLFNQYFENHWKKVHVISTLFTK